MQEYLGYKLSQIFSLESLEKLSVKFYAFEVGGGGWQVIPAISHISKDRLRIWKILLFSKKKRKKNMV